MSTIIQRSFAAGEISPELYSRTDTVKYQQGLKKARNFIIEKFGGATNRPGTQFIGETKDSSKTSRLIPFIFNDDDSYMLEFGDLYMRVIRNGAYVSDLSLTITGITKANPAVITYTGTDPSNGDEFYLSGISGMTEMNGRNVKVANVNGGANTFEVQNLNGTNLDSSAFTTYTSGGTAARIYTVVSPYAESRLENLYYSQSGDVMTLAHNAVQPYRLSRSGHSSWTFTAFTEGAEVADVSSLTNSGAAGSTVLWQVTPVSRFTGEEGEHTQTGSSTTPSSGSPVTLSWASNSEAKYFKIYRYDSVTNSGYIGTTSVTSFIDNGLTLDKTKTFYRYTNYPWDGSPIVYPNVVFHSSQRLGFAYTRDDPNTIWLSRLGTETNFASRLEFEDEESFAFSLSGAQASRIRHVLDLGKTVVLTATGEWVLNGDGTGIITPTAINAKQQSYNGASRVRPVVIDNNAIYVQDRGSIIRDLGFEFESDGYRGTDLTTFSSHLVRGFEIKALAYQANPNSLVWALRDDGKLVCITYVREQQIIAFSQHETEGTVESIACIPEGDEDALYMIVKRTDTVGTVYRYVERMYPRQYGSDIKDAKFVDAGISYDGRNTSASHLMTLTTSSDWVYTTTLTLTSSAAYFSSSDVGNEIHLTGSDGELIRFTITGYTSTTVVTGTPNRTVPSSLQATATSDWARAVDEVSGLWHLVRQSVSVFGDGFVIANPNNPSYTEVAVPTSGRITLERPYSVIHVGLPYTSDLQTLDIDTVSGESMIDKKKIVNNVSMHVVDTRGVWAGTEEPEDDSVGDDSGLFEVKVRDAESMDDPNDLQTGVIDVAVESSWNRNGSVFIRQSDPLPCTIASVAPAGLAPVRGR